jgi:hypothetical protein
MAVLSAQILLVILITIVGVYVWKESRQNSTLPNTPTVGPKIAIVVLMRKPTDVALWFNHHRNAGVSRFYVRVEDSPGVAAYLRTQPDVYFEEGVSDPENNYTTFQVRQREFVNTMLPKARADGMDWVFHIDVDELLEGDLKAALRKIPETALIGKLKNAEAVYTEEEPTCFSAKKFIRCDKGGPCQAYVNGKGVGRPIEGVSLGGPHDFVYRGKVDATVTYPIPFEDLHVLHYDSCTLGTWLEKFAHMSKKAKLDDIVFPYYKKSIEVAVKSKELYKEMKMRDDLDPKWTHIKSPDLRVATTH